MPRFKGKKNLSHEIIKLIMTKAGDGEATAQIARDLRQPYHTVYGVIKRGGNTGKSTGRPKVIEPRIERRILRAVSKNPDLYATELAHEFCPRVSARTVRRLLRRRGLLSRIKREKPALTPAQKAARLQFALEHRDKPLSFWSNVLWSDESKIYVTPLRRRRLTQKPHRP